MKELRYITCSDIRENIPEDKIIDLLHQYPKAEIGIQAHCPCMNEGMPRNIWLNKILDESDSFCYPLNIAIHVNYDWCSAFCLGQIPEALRNILNRKHEVTGLPIVKRWQLNIGDGTIIPSAKAVSEIIKSYPYQEFIFPYNDNPYIQDFINRLDKTGAKFSLLFDASYGAGISPDYWKAPIYENHYQGYAGGLSPENVTENLKKINNVTGARKDIWIDAEGKLMKPGTRIFDLDRAKAYIMNALKWHQNQK